MNITGLLFAAAVTYGFGLFVGRLFKGLNPFLMAIGIVMGGLVAVRLIAQTNIVLDAAFIFGVLYNFKRALKNLTSSVTGLWMRIQLMFERRAYSKRSRARFEEEQHSSRPFNDDGARQRRENAKAQEKYRRTEEELHRQAEDLRRKEEAFRHKQEKASRRKGRSKSRVEQEQTSPHRRKKVDHRTPEEILGVNPGASRSEIDTCYKRQCNRYHPDKYSHMSEEYIREAAEEFMAVKDAYQKLKRQAE